jgi:hypothetical protein
VPASPSSSDARRSGSRRWVPLTLLLACACVCVLASCATVRPEDREKLADPAMSFDSAAMAARQKQHLVDNREGSTGGGTAKGGGCGCN